MQQIDNWKISSYSMSGNTCVEVGHGVGIVGVRDTKDDHRTHTIVVSGGAWEAFLAEVCH